MSFFQAPVRVLLFILGFSVLWGGCTINRDIMFKTGEDFDFAPLEEIDSPGYRIAPNDMLQFRLFSNKGQRLNQMTAGGVGTGNQQGNQQMNNMMNQQGGVTYLVKPDGLVELPELGDIRLEGLTIEEAEALLEEAYASFYKDPFVILRVQNNRVYIFPGESGRASVVTLQNMNTTLLEVLAMTGGIGSRANASKVKLIRKTDTGNEIYKMDLSTIEGLDAANTVVQAYDIIYVEPMPQLVRETTESLTPITSLISTLTFFYAFIVNPN
jgi:polysaccharide export outer membrane protein